MLAKGIVLTGDRQAHIVAQEVPDPAGRQVLIRTHAVGLCGSDLALFNGTYAGPRNYPIYFGHEWSGVVAAVGPEVTRVRPGDRVTGDCSIYCGACEFCAQDKNLCKHIQKFGITMDGASRQYFLQDERYVYRADPAADLDLIALCEPLAVGARAVQRVCAVRPNLAEEKVLVLGGGAIGLACFCALKYLHGVARVELYDILTARMARAQALGAAEPADVQGGEESLESYDALYSGRGYDAIFETTGAAASFRQALRLLRPLGAIMQVGFINAAEVNLRAITLKAAHLLGSMGGTGQFPDVLDFILRRPELAAQMVSHRVPFTEGERAFEAAAERENAMKVLVTFN